jgi:dTDP-D-glucose 4,6-dehydratase
MGTMIVTGGAGFIGCNFVRTALERTGDRVVVLDKLTCAGNLESLADVASHPRYAFVRGDIADRDAADHLVRAWRETWGLPTLIRYNIGGSGEQTNRQLVDLLCAEMERQLPARENPALRAKRSAGRRRTTSPPAARRRSRGIWRTPPGASPSSPAATAASGSGFRRQGEAECRRG